VRHRAHAHCHGCTDSSTDGGTDSSTDGSTDGGTDSITDGSADAGIFDGGLFKDVAVRGLVVFGCAVS
jgi:hypothetical protein